MDISFKSTDTRRCLPFSFYLMAFTPSGVFQMFTSFERIFTIFVYVIYIIYGHKITQFDSFLKKTIVFEHLTHIEVFVKSVGCFCLSIKLCLKSMCYCALFITAN